MHFVNFIVCRHNALKEAKMETKQYVNNIFFLFLRFTRPRIILKTYQVRKFTLQKWLVILLT